MNFHRGFSIRLMASWVSLARCFDDRSRRVPKGKNVGVCSRSTCVYRRGGLEVRSSLRSPMTIGKGERPREGRPVGWHPRTAPLEIETGRPPPRRHAGGEGVSVASSAVSEAPVVGKDEVPPLRSARERISPSVIPRSRWTQPKLSSARYPSTPAQSCPPLRG